MGRRGLIFALIATLLALTGCTKEVYIPKETIKTDSIYVSHTLRDSIYLFDSIYVREKGDTIFVDQVRYKYVERFARDTIISERVDSIFIPQLIEKKLSKHEEIYLRVGELTVWTIIMLVIIVVGGFLLRLLK